jgi:hypothetical protein
MNATRVAALLFAGLVAAGCGGGADVRTTTTTVSVGQQLIDLKKARDSGAMTTQEFEKAKRELIQRTLEN